MILTRRVLYTIDSFAVGGAQRQLLELVRHLDKERYRVAVCPLWDIPDLDALYCQTGVEIVRIHKRFSADASVAFRLAQWIRRFQPHVVHTWLFTGSLWGRLAALLARSPVVIASERSVRPAGYDSLPVRFFSKALIGCTDAITANSQVGIDALHKQGYAAGKTRLIFNGVDTHRFSPSIAARARLAERQKLGLPADAVVIGMVARLSYPKDQPALLRALARLLHRGENIYGLIVGSGPARDSLLALANELGIAGRVVFAGQQKDVAPFLSTMDVFVLSSFWEGMPNAVLEAMAMGLPVVATDVAGTAEAVLENDTGFLVSPGDVDALVEKLSYLMHDTDVRTRMGGAARQRAEQVFSLEQMVIQTTALYDELLEKKVPPSER